MWNEGLLAGMKTGHTFCKFELSMKCKDLSKGLVSLLQSLLIGYNSDLPWLIGPRGQIHVQL